MKKFLLFVLLLIGGGTFAFSQQQIPMHIVDNSAPIEVINYETGRSVYSGIFYDGLSISTIGWKPGIYIVVCNNGEKKVTQKITVK